MMVELIVSHLFAFAMGMVTIKYIIPWASR
jgi:hypothetical protein